MTWGQGNSGAGSGGGFNRHDAILRVQAPASSIVTITKGSYHKSDYGHENYEDHTKYDYYFVVHQSQFDSSNPWSVTARLGSNEVTRTIIIDDAEEYDLVLYFEFIILSSTNTSQIANLTRLATGNPQTFALDANNRFGHSNERNTRVGGFLHYLYLDLTPYNVMTLAYTEMNANAYYSGHFGIYVMSGENTPTIITATGSSVPANLTGSPTAYLATDRYIDNRASGTSTGTFTIDLTPYTGAHYVGFALGRGSVGAGDRPWGGWITDWRLD